MAWIGEGEGEGDLGACLTGACLDEAVVWGRLWMDSQRSGEGVQEGFRKILGKV